MKAYTTGTRRLWAAGLLLGLLALACSQTPQPLELPTPVPNDATPAVDVVGPMLPGMPEIPAGLPRYNILLNLDHANRTYQGYARVEYTNLENTWLDRLYFRLYPNGGQVFGPGTLTVTQAWVDGQPTQFTTSLLGTVLELPLPVNLEVGQSVAVEMDFTGNVPQDFGGSGPNYGYGIFNYTGGVLALAGWYPMLAVYDQDGWNLDPVYAIGDPIYIDAALYTVELNVDPALVVATTGVAVSQTVVEGRAVVRYESGPAREFFLIASPDYQIASQVVDGTKVNVYTLPGGEPGVEAALQVSSAAILTYNQRFGAYPYAEFDLVQAPLNIAVGVEYPGIILVGSSLYGSPQSTTFSNVIAHEVAHQWWYNVVGNDVSDDPWLDEALTTYSSILFWELTQGADAQSQALTYIQTAHDGIVLNGQDGPVAASLEDFVETGREASYSPVVYAKGGLFFHALRQTVGDEVFFTVLERYYSEHWFGIAQPVDLLNAFELTADLELNSLYETWLYNPPLPGHEPTATPTPYAIPTSPVTPTLAGDPTATSIAPVTFAVIGDYGSNNEGEDRVANLVWSWNPDLIITVGDNNYPEGSAETIDDAVGRYYQSYIYPYAGQHGPGATFNRFFPCLGNHDLYSDDGQPYFDYFTLPGNERYYDFVWGGVHFFCLNSNDNEPDGVGRSSAQAAWLQYGLATSTTPWNVVYFHHPPYSSGHHGSVDWMRWPFAAWGADLVLSGHDHLYERLEVDGIPYIINGLGGGDIYDFEESLPESRERYSAQYGAMLVEATEQRMIIQFITYFGEVIDYLELSR